MKLVEKTKTRLDMPRLVVEIISLVLQVVLLYCAFTKLIWNKEFKFALSLTPAFKDINTYLLWVTPITELIIAFLLYLKKTRLFGFLLCIVLFALYLLAMFNLKLFVPHIRGGILNHLTFNEYLVLDILLLLLSITGVGVMFKGRPVVNKLAEHQVVYT